MTGDTVTLKGLQQEVLEFKRLVGRQAPGDFSKLAKALATNIGLKQGEGDRTNLFKALSLLRQAEGVQRKAGAKAQYRGKRAEAAVDPVTEYEERVARVGGEAAREARRPMGVDGCLGQSDLSDGGLLRGLVDQERHGPPRPKWASP